MAVEFNVKTTRDALYKCFPEEIEIRAELNGRHELPDIEHLITDILKQGQIQPVGVWSDGGTPVLAYGFSRWRAISEINKRELTPVPLKISFTNVGKVNEQGAFLRNISENRMRNATSTLDDAHNIQRLFNWTMDEKDVAKIYFPMAATEEELRKAVKWIQDRVSLLRLTPEAQDALKDGRLKETAAKAIAKLSSKQQREVIKNPTKKPKKLKIDAELRRRITAVTETADFDAYDEKTTVWIEVNAESLAALKDYIA